MPVSEDEFDRPVVNNNQTTMSKAEQRKSNKPIMEKRRRARINHCLNELKTLILDAMKKDPARHSKLEKADILEMTVKHLQQIQRQHLATAVATDPAVIMRFKSGFDECAAEVSRYIGRMGNVDDSVKQRLIAHLHRCVNSLQQVNVFPQQQQQQSVFPPPACDKTGIVLPSAVTSSVPGDVNNNSNQTPERIHIPAGLQLIPSRLPSGELALLVPNSNQISSFLQAAPQFPPVLSPTTFAGGLNKGPSAFTAVGKPTDTPSPSDTVVTYATSSDDVPKYGQVSSSSFQRKPADSTSRDDDTIATTTFKPFQVDIPNSHARAQINVPSGFYDDAAGKIQQKPNPNLTLNPNKAKSPQKYARCYPNEATTTATMLPKTDLGLEKFLKIEPLSIITEAMRPRSAEAFPGVESPTMRAVKRPLSTESASPTSTEPSPSKAPRISLNFMVTDGFGGAPSSTNGNNAAGMDQCQRISVIVDDGKRDGSNGSVSQQQQQQQQQRDMWRPW